MLPPGDQLRTVLSAPAVLYSSTVNSSGVVVGVAVSEDGVGFIKDWVRTWHYLESESANFNHFSI